MVFWSLMIVIYIIYVKFKEIESFRVCLLSLKFLKIFLGEFG